MTSWYVDLVLLAVLFGVLWKMRAGPLRGIMPYVRRTAQVSAWVVVILMVLAVMVVVGGPLGFLLWLVTLVIISMTAGRYRDTERRMLLWSLELAAEKGFPLPAAARAFALERGGGIGRRASRLAAALESGLPLDAALAASGTRLSTSALVAVRAGCETGRLAAALRGATEAEAAVDSKARLAGSQLAYLFLLVWFSIGTMIFIRIKLIPEFIKIFDGFGLRFPPMTIVMVNLGQFLISPSAWFAYIVLLFLALYALARYAGVVRWEPPLLRRFSRELDAAIVLRALRLAVDQRQPLSAAIASLAKHYPRAHVRDRLKRAKDMVSHGANWCDSLEQAGLVGPVEVAVLKSAEKIDNLGWALGEMADRQVRRFTARVSALNTYGFPLVLMLIAGVVFVAAVGAFMPIAEMIGRLS